MREHDVVLFGATGFTGKLVAEYLSKHAKARWAIAGRSKDKLEAVKRELGIDVPVLVADADDEASLDALVPRAKVVCTTVGPYAKYGRKLVASCTRHGTHYCDITGEVPFIRWSIDECHAKAEGARTRIVHCCGFDSIPFDLGVHMLWDHAKKPLAWAKGFAGKTKGTFSGGTFASMMNLMEDMTRDRSMRRLLANPHALEPDAKPSGDRERDQAGVRFDEDLGRWTAPFLMAQVNTRIVRRSNALLHYGDRFTYAEAMSTPPGPKGLLMAAGVTAALGAFVAAA
ncbi:MAG TPA: saccharopine dehydrogenase NADP-binding domain-containing protein, partial [Labilithrix sp.]